MPDELGFHPIAPWRPNDYTKPKPSDDGPKLVITLDPNFRWFNP